ncbi:uncharacterized protein MYCFIDRAFT_81749 [Pseudocercospora fijiensis CIRAD86]|uniref:Uncharacterized protein n=1 Tax=Pseudocercospora fijiensis (strain CIRAD86) TaxID=383855 RepID=M2Z0L1_PSEFD|nr:uncharacterized protein MYCFIDRAFT_81749 [Pseudocercospora fijiensis CIRAD86]EME83380.1 hypothetical protein MYCFIDRAFT_81749 [Pseudocercospora fijiensis CIRAD86]
MEEEWPAEALALVRKDNMRERAKIDYKAWERIYPEAHYGTVQKRIKRMRMKLRQQDHRRAAFDHARGAPAHVTGIDEDGLDEEECPSGDDSREEAQNPDPIDEHDGDGRNEDDNVPFVGISRAAQDLDILVGAPLRYKEELINITLRHFTCNEKALSEVQKALPWSSSQGAARTHFYNCQNALVALGLLRKKPERPISNEERRAVRAHPGRITKRKSHFWHKIFPGIVRKRSLGRKVKLLRETIALQDYRSAYLQRTGMVAEQSMDGSDDEDPGSDNEQEAMDDGEDDAD